MLAAARLHRTAAVTAGRLVAPRRFSTALELPEIGEEHDMLKQMCRDFADVSNMNLTLNMRLHAVDWLLRASQAELKPIAGEIDRDHRYPATQIAKLGELGLMRHQDFACLRHLGAPLLDRGGCPARERGFGRVDGRLHHSFICVGSRGKHLSRRRVGDGERTGCLYQLPVDEALREGHGVDICCDGSHVEANVGLAYAAGMTQLWYQTGG